MKHLRLMLTNFRKGSSGAVAVESAIVIPILLVLTLSIADFGRYYFTGITMKQATTEAARAVALRQPASYVAALLDDSLGSVPQLALSDATVTTGVPFIVYCPISSTTTSLAKVEIQLEFVWLTPLGFLYGADSSGWSGANSVITIASEAVCAS
jgi:hypothetical protein